MLIIYSIYHKKIIAKLLWHAGMTKDEIIEAVGGKIINPENMDDEDVIINGEKYFYNDIESCYEEELPEHIKRL